LSQLAPVLRIVDPGGKRRFNSAVLMTGPLTRKMSVGNCPLRGPASAALTGRVNVNDEVNGVAV
jgi:hypothetical protein